MDLLYFLLIGLVAGWLAGLIMKGGGFGIVGDLIVGCIGALIGGFVFSRLGIRFIDPLIDSLVVATVGAILLLLLLRVLKKA
jgi:uncharacterized membrane protein YeaQ/YmgE (transglycosylase-associated protein family)